MQTNLEQVTKIIRTLPLEDFNKVREVLDEEEQERKRIETDKKIGLEQRIEKFKKGHNAPSSSRRHRHRGRLFV